MSIERNKTLVQRHLDLSWNEGDIDALDQVWASDAVVHLWDGRTLTGLDALQEHLRASVLLFTDSLLDVEDIIGEGETVATRWSFSGIVAAASGGRLTITGMDFYRISAGKIVEEWIEVSPPEGS